MTVTITPKTPTPAEAAATLLFFSKTSPAAAEAAKKLLAAGATLKVEFMAISVTHPKFQGDVLPLPANTSAVIKGTLAAGVHAALVKTVEGYLAQALLAITGEGYGLPAEPKAPALKVPAGHSVSFDAFGKLVLDSEPVTQPNPDEVKFAATAAKIVDTKVAKAALFGTLTGAPSPEQIKKVFSPMEAKALLEAWKKAFPTLVTPVPVAPGGPATHSLYMGPASADTAVPLKDATMLNQPVRGTSKGSVYRVIALGPNVRMACRIKNGSLSVRVEGNLTDGEKMALLAMNFADNATYLSCHYTLAGVPAERVLGCLLFNPEIPLTQKVSSLKEVGGGV